GGISKFQRGTRGALGVATMKKLLVLLALSGACAFAGCASSSEPENACSGSSGEALTVCAAGPILKGVDVSVYQGTVNWNAVKARGGFSGSAGGSDGLTHPDRRCAATWSGMKSAGVLRGAYKFSRPGEDPTAQADLFVSKMGPLGEDDLPPVMDME